jgi:hypothetical protein
LRNDGYSQSLAKMVLVSVSDVVHVWRKSGK